MRPARAALGFTFAAAPDRRLYATSCVRLPFQPRHIVMTTSAAELLLESFVVGQNIQLPLSRDAMPAASLVTPSQSPDFVAAHDAFVVELAERARLSAPLLEGADPALADAWWMVWDHAALNSRHESHMDPAHVGTACTLTVRWPDKATPRTVHALVLGWALR